MALRAWASSTWPSWVSVVGMVVVVREGDGGVADHAAAVAGGVARVAQVEQMRREVVAAGCAGLLCRLVPRVLHAAAHFLHAGQEVPELLGLLLDLVVHLGELLLHHFGHAGVEVGRGNLQIRL